MRYLVTGATGFVGGAVARQLLDAGHQVRALVRTPAAAAALAARGVEIHAGDVGDKDTLVAPMTGVDGVFHVAGWYKLGIPDRAAAVRANIDGTRNVLQLMGDLRIPKGVYTSTLAVNSDTHGQLVDETYRFQGRHLTVYDETKAAAHRIADDFIACGLPLVIVQPGLVYGPGDTSGVKTMFDQFLERKLPGLPSRTAYAWGYIDDIAAGHLLAMSRGAAGRHYFLAGPVHTLIEAMAIASDVTGIPPPRWHLPPVALRAASALAGLAERFTDMPTTFSSEGLRVLAGVTYIGRHDRARQELGWSPRSLRDGLALTLPRR